MSRDTSNILFDDSPHLTYDHNGPPIHSKTSATPHNSSSKRSHQVLRTIARFILHQCSCNCLFDKTVIVLYSLVSREPYLALIHTIISLPLSMLFFSFMFILLGIGGFFYCICGVGIFLLAVMSGFLRFMTFVEILLARYLLCMKDTLDYPEFIKSVMDKTTRGITSAGPRKRKKKKHKKKQKKRSINYTKKKSITPNNSYSMNSGHIGSNSLTSGVAHEPTSLAVTGLGDAHINLSSSSAAISLLLSPERKRTTILSKSSDTKVAEEMFYAFTASRNEKLRRESSYHHRFSGERGEIGATSVINPDEEISIGASVSNYEISTSDDSETDSDSDTDNEVGYNIFSSDQGRRSYGSPDETNHYYYQQYGTMMSRSLDTGSPHSYSRPSSANILLYGNENALARSSNIISNNMKQHKKKKRKVRTSQNKELSTPHRNNLTVDSPIAKSRGYGTGKDSHMSKQHRQLTSTRRRWYSIGRWIVPYVFDSHVGFSILYVVVKLPVSVLTFFTSIFLIGFPLLLISTPLFHIVCKSLKQQTLTCSILLDPNDFHNAWLPLVSWAFWFIYNDVGNAISCLIGCMLLPVCVFLLGPVTRMAKDAVTLIGEDMEQVVLDDDDD